MKIEWEEEWWNPLYGIGDRKTYKARLYHSYQGGAVPEEFENFKKFIEELEKKIPDGMRDMARLKFRTDGDDGYEADCELFLIRPESDEEYVARKWKEKTEAEMQSQIKERKERQEYERLKKKYR